MPKLSEVITAILSSLNNAQHQSNKRSRSLADSYRNDEIMKFFALPNAQLAEADITLKYAIKSVQKTASPEDAKDSPDETLYAIRKKATRIVDGILRNESVQNGLAAKSLDKKEMECSLVDAVGECMYHGKKKGRSDSEIAKDVEEKLQGVLGCAPAVSTLLQSKPALLNSVADKAGDTVDDMEVIVDNEILQGLPESVIQTIQLKARVKNFHWIVDQKSSTGEFIQTD